MIEVKSLYKSFEGKDVLVDINAIFDNGKTNLIIGQSGSGKTVLMKCIVGLLIPEKGEILYDGRNFLSMNKKEKKTLRREMEPRWRDVFHFLHYPLSRYRFRIRFSHISFLRQGRCRIKVWLGQIGPVRTFPDRCNVFLRGQAHP